jgi:hypothetical protein
MPRTVGRGSDKGCTESIVTWTPWQRGYTRAENYGATNAMPTQNDRPLVEEEAPLLNMYISRREQKCWSWISRRLNPGMTVLTKASSNLTASLHWQMYCVYLAWQLFIVVKWQSVYGVLWVQMPFPGRCVSAGALVRNCCATNMAPTQKDKPLLSSKRRPHFQTHKRSWNERKLGHASRRVSKPTTTVLARAEDWVSRVVRQSPASKDVNRETEESTVLRAVTRQPLSKTNWEDLVRAVVNWKVRKLARLLWLHVVTICKCSVNPIQSKPRF